VSSIFDFCRLKQLKKLSIAKRIASLAIVALAMPASAQRSVQSLSFSGYNWEIRQNAEPEGPKNNCFGGRDLSVFLESGQPLRLSVSYKEGTWYAAEVILKKRLGYGTYVFRIVTPLANLDPKLVLGLFTYTSSPGWHNREIDIEFSAWGVSGAPTLGQFVVQPYDKPGNMVTFPVSRLNGPTTFSFTWLPDRVDFVAWMGYGPRPAAGDRAIVAAWTFAEKAAIPKPGSEYVHMNLYLANGGTPPAGRGSTEITIDGFEFLAAAK
jgi:hypothetical protein